METMIKALLKELDEQHISKHIVCPSVPLIVKDLLQYGYTEIIDERSAGYVATGMCAEACEPIVLWCANDISFRNLAPALTEAYFRKLPLFVIAISGVAAINHFNNPNDILRYMFHVSRYIPRDEYMNIIRRAVHTLFCSVQGPCLLLIDEISTPIENKEEYKKSEWVNKDGKLSKLIGASIVEPTRLFIGKFTRDEVMRDVNMLGNRHLLGNIVVVIIDGNVEDDALWDIAMRMQWSCKRMTTNNFEESKSELIIESIPQYIEIIK